MRSDKQIEASRTNGKKSRGPISEQGRNKSSRNASTHNLASEHFILLSNEDPEAFAAHQYGFLRRFQPIDAVEYGLVQKLIIASWRERRIAIMESAVFEMEMERQRPTVDAEFLELGVGTRQVLAIFGTTEAAEASSLLLRYGATARRDFSSAYRILRDLQGDRFNSTAHYAPAPAPTQQPSAESENDTPVGSNSEPASEPQASSSSVLPSQTRAKLTVVRRRFEKSYEFRAKIAKLRNEPKPAAPEIAIACGVGASAA
jgi:hypothetical protein